MQHASKEDVNGYVSDSQKNIQINLSQKKIFCNVMTTIKYPLPGAARDILRY